MSRTILHCDLNNFFASVELLHRPELADKPLAVCGSVEDRHGIVLAKNYPAKYCGVKTGEAIWQAKEKCPDLITAPPRYDEYEYHSRKVRSIYERYTDEIEPMGIDECFLDVSRSIFAFGSGEKIANKIRESVKRECSLTISAGVSFNKVFAKLGSDMKKPDAVTVIGEDDFRQKIWGLPASDMLGVGKKTAAVLYSHGCRTIGDIARMPIKYLSSWLGRAGESLWIYANGLDSSAVIKTCELPPPKSISHGSTEYKDLTNTDEVDREIAFLSQEVGVKLRRERLAAKTVAVTVKDSGFAVREYQQTLSKPTNITREIVRSAQALFSSRYVWNNPVRSVTVSVKNLTSENDFSQLSLFDDVTKREKLIALERTTDSLRGRFGFDILSPASAGKMKRDKNTPVSRAAF